MPPIASEFSATHLKTDAALNTIDTVYDFFVRIVREYELARFAERHPNTRASLTPVSLELNVLFENVIAELSSNRLQTLMWEIAPVSQISPSEPIQISVQQQVESASSPQSDYQWLMEVLKALGDIVNRNVNSNFATLTETDYGQLDAMLKELVYITCRGGIFFHW